MFLWVAGVAVGIVAAMLEDDENETFLERSRFGLGRNMQMGKFVDLEQEMKAMATLAQGFRAELEWNDNSSSPDIITVRLQTIEWDRTRRSMSFVLDGYDKINGGKLSTLAEGELIDIAEQSGVFVAEREVPMNSPSAKAVKLTFTLWDTNNKLPGVPLKMNRGATKMAEDFIWMED